MIFDFSWLGMKARTALSILVLLYTVLKLDATANEAQNLLSTALKHVLGPVRSKLQHVDVRSTSFRRRCFKSTACEFPFPATELHAVAFKNGEVYVEANLSAVYPLITEMAKYYGGQYMHLQSSLIQIGQASDWIIGPKLNVVTNISQFCHWQDPASRENKEDTHALFLFPWETNNAYHALQDNILSVLTTVILQYLTAPTVSVQDTPLYTLYVFNRIGRESMGETALLYDLLPVIFGEEYVLPAKALLRGGPHCVKHVSWGPAMKIFNRDSLVDLRRAAYDVLQHIMHGHRYISHKQSGPQRQSNQVDVSVPGYSNVRSAAPESRKLKAIIVTRAATLDHTRRLHPDTEHQLVNHLQRSGFATEICCNFKAVTTITQLLDKFQDVDICIGIHGAGLSNCIFGRRSSMTIVELQTHHGYGVMSFPKLAHMSGGDYLFYDLRTVDPSRVLDQGISVPVHTIENIVQLAVKVYSYRNGVTISQHTETSSMAQRLWQAIHPFGQAKPVERIDTVVTASPTMPAALHSTVSLAIKTAIVEPQTNSLYVQFAQNISTEERRYYQNILNSILGTTYALHSMDAWTTSAVTNTTRGNSVRKKQPKEHDMTTIKRNNGTYWILFNPSTQPYTMNSILGPPVKASYATCTALPYHQFRKLTLSPGNPAMHECDQNIVLRRRTGKHDAKLLTYFID